jgi:hypothetical protein
MMKDPYLLTFHCYKENNNCETYIVTTDDVFGGQLQNFQDNYNSKICLLRLLSTSNIPPLHQRVFQLKYTLILPLLILILRTRTV